MTLKEALEDIIARPCKRALVGGDGLAGRLVYFDDTWDEAGFFASRSAVGHLSGCRESIGFGFPIFTVFDVRSDKHEVINVNFVPFKKKEAS